MTARSTPRPGRTGAGRPAGRRSPRRRRLAGFFVLGLALLFTGLGYTVLVPAPQAANAAGDDAALARAGEPLFNAGCVTCHGANLEGVAGRGPSLIGVGSAAAYFQVSSGRMPLARQEAQAERKPQTRYSDDEVKAIAAYVAAHGGGPSVPDQSGDALRGDDPARGGELFRLNCASCHNFTGRGGALSSGKFAPTLDPATEQQIYTAMLSGPQNMPKFSDRQLTPEEKKDVIAYVRSVTDGNNNPGGNSLGGLGPVPEGMVIFIGGVGALIGIALWIGGRK